MPTKFDREISAAGMQLLEAKPKWWRDLLAFRYQGSAKQEQKLFVAVRDGYLNAYVDGQSVLKIGFDTKSQPAKLNASVHHKYICAGATGQAYLKFDGNGFYDKSGAAVAPTTLERRVELAQTYAGDEKRGVASIAARHSQVIDVEMALPAAGSQAPDAKPTAARMDIVALERAGAGASIVFYEAKLFRNPALRAKGTPLVLQQLGRYEEWLNSPGHADSVVRAYRRACQLLVQIGAMHSADLPSSVHPLVQKAADCKFELKVDPKPRLIVFGPGSQALRDSWPQHEGVLRRHGVRLLMGHAPEDIVLPDAAA